MRNKYKTRDEILRNKLIDILKTNDVDKVFNVVKDYESANLITIDKLSRVKKLDIKKISGALKQCIQAHGSITENYISSAAKRIYGSVMLEEKCEEKKSIINPLSIRGIILGALITSIIYSIIHFL